jgi:hypothetical protein
MLQNILSCVFLNPLKPTFVFIIFKNSVRTSKRTPHFTITKIDWLMLFKELIDVYNEKHHHLLPHHHQWFYSPPKGLWPPHTVGFKHMKPISTKCIVNDY